jgi:hypothetical protein
MASRRPGTPKPATAPARAIERLFDGAADPADTAGIADPADPAGGDEHRPRPASGEGTDA